MKSLLVLLDDDPSGEAARTLAIATATRLNARVVGLSIHDIGAVLQAETSAFRSTAQDGPVAVGVEESRAHREGLIKAFSAACESAGVQYDSLVFEGVVGDILPGVAPAHDMVVLGKQANYEMRPKSDSEELVSTLLRYTCRPLLVVPALEFEGEDVLVAYDGSPPSARALQLATLLGLLEGRTAHIVNAGDSAEEIAAISGRAEQYVSAYGVKTVRHDIENAGNPADVLSERIKLLNPGLLVMGAYGHRGIRDYFLGSSTSNLLQYSPIPVFIHH